jgi:hypothetical protein
MKSSQATSNVDAELNNQHLTDLHHQGECGELQYICEYIDKGYNWSHNVCHCL